jgi:ABC-2 type transport system permease protein
VRMTLLILVGLVPFAALGILIGHLVTVDSIGPVMGGTVSLLALVSGTWFPIGKHSFLHDVAENLPSYWLVQASHVALNNHGWGTRGWVVVAVWTAVLIALARRAYQRDTERV